MSDTAQNQGTVPNQAPALEIQLDPAARPIYSNFCRVTGTPEEVALDFALNLNAFGRVLDETI